MGMIFLDVAKAFNCIDHEILYRKMHKAGFGNLEQRRCIQLLSLMYKISKNNVNRAIGPRNTRQNVKYVFRKDTKIGTKYLNSPFFKGCKIWDTLSKEIQFSESMALFKQSIYILFKPFDKNFLV